MYIKIGWWEQIRIKSQKIEGCQSLQILGVLQIWACLVPYQRFSKILVHLHEQKLTIISIKEEVMSIIDSTPQQICNSPTNSSKAKMLYSFPKSNRFPKDKENKCDQFYEINQKGNVRATNLGYGNKYDFTRDSPKTPAPGSYQSKTGFEQAVTKKKGFGFGSGRGQMEVTGFIKSNSNPGPGAYETTSKRPSSQYSMKGKSKVDNREKTPGPGSYETITSFNTSGRLFSSKYKNRSATHFNKEEKLVYKDIKVPGPGAYDYSKTELSPDGRYFYSRLQSAKNSKFGKQSRLGNSNRCQTPGPGNYRLPSEFGYYVNRQSLNGTNGKNYAEI